MGLATIPDLLYPPPPLGVSGQVSIQDGYLLDAAGESFALLCQAPLDGVIRKVHVAVGSVFASGDVEARIEGVTSGAAPDGSLNGTATKTQTVSASGWTTFDFGASNGATVTRGQDLSLVFKNDTISPANLYLKTFLDTRDQFNAGFPLLYSSNAAGIVNYLPLLAIEYSTGELPAIPGVLPGVSLFGPQWVNTDNPKTRGLKFRLEFPARLVGCWVWLDTSTAGGAGDYTVELFDAAGARFSTRVKRDFPPLYNAGEAPAVQFCRFDVAQTLAKNADYRLCVTPSGANSCQLNGFDVADNAYLAAYPGGANWHYTATNADPPTLLGDWTDTDTSRPLMGLILDQLHDGDASAESAILPARRRIAAPAVHVRRRLSAISVLPPPAALPILVRSRRRVQTNTRIVRRVQPTAFSQTIINQTAIIAYSRKVR